MNEFHEEGGTLFCEEVPAAELARIYGTPLFVYSRRAFENRFTEVRDAFAALNPLIAYSVKSNSNLAVLQLLSRAGAGADIVSGGELHRCLKAGMDPKKIVYAGVGKTGEEIRYALQSGIRLFNVESMPELFALNRIAGELRVRARASLRINPDVDAKTHAKTTTGKKENKFGLPVELAADYYREGRGLPNVVMAGIDVHLGSPICSTDPYLSALGKLLPLIADLRKNGVPLEDLDLGGGFAIVYNDEKPFTPAELARAVEPAVKKSGLSLILEPGRYISGNSGLLLTRVLYVKTTPCKNFIITDAGMNDLVRPAFYNSFHRISPVDAAGAGAPFTADVVGPICESSDFLAKDRLLPRPEEGGVLAVHSAGAYGFTMSSSYNSRRRAAEVLVQGGRHTLVRDRESWDDLIRGERLVEQA